MDRRSFLKTVATLAIGSSLAPATTTAALSGDKEAYVDKHDRLYDHLLDRMDDPAQPYEHDSPISIVAEGGAIHSAYTLGVLKALNYHYGLRSADYVTGVSSAAPTLTYYASNQLEALEDIWLDVISQSDYKNWANLLIDEPLFDIDYLVDDILADSDNDNPEEALDMEALQDTDTDIIIPATDCYTGDARFFSEESYDRFYDDFYDIIRASMAEPFTYRENIPIDGSKYFDGFFSAPIPYMAPEVKDTQKIVILTQTEDEGKPPKNIWKKLKLSLKRSMAEPISHEMKDAIYTSKQLYWEQRQDLMDELEDDDILLKPSRDIPKLDNDREDIIASMVEGYRDALYSTELQQLFPPRDLDLDLDIDIPDLEPEPITPQPLDEYSR